MSSNARPTKRKRSSLREEVGRRSVDMHFKALKKNFDSSLEIKQALQTKVCDQEKEMEVLQDENSQIRLEIKKLEEKQKQQGIF